MSVDAVGLLRALQWLRFNLIHAPAPPTTLCLVSHLASAHVMLRNLAHALFGDNERALYRSDPSLVHRTNRLANRRRGAGGEHTALAVLWNPLTILGVTATGLFSINVALTGSCPVGNVLRLFGFTPMLGSATRTRWNLYFLQIDRWYLERRIYLAVGINISVASILVLVLVLVLVLALRPWWTLFTFFVGGAMVRRYQLLHHGECALLAWGRAAAQSGSHAVGPLR